MASIASTFVSAILPVLAIAAAGYLLGRVRAVDVEPVNAVTLYVLMPALVLHSLLSTGLGGAAVAGLVAAMIGFTFVMMALSAAVGRALGESGPALTALAFTGAFPNTGNFGIPVATFAFGSVGRDVAVVFVIVQNVLFYTLGVVLVAGTGSGTARTAGRRIVRLPVVHAVVLALAVRAAGVAPPPGGVVMDTLRLVGDASIPLFLVILGLQLAASEPGGTLKRTLPAVGLKLLVAPVVGVGVALTLAIDPPAAARAFVLLCAGPIAVSPLVLFVEFGDDADGTSGAAYLSTAVFVTTLASVVVVTAAIVLLRAGVVL